MTRPAPEELLPPLEDEDAVCDAELPNPLYTAVPELLDPVAEAVPDALVVAFDLVGLDAPH